MHNPPELLPPDQTPPIRSTADLHRLWRAIMGRPGQTRRHLWFMLLGADGSLTGVISQIEDVPTDPYPQTIDGLIAALSLSMRSEMPDGAIACLLTRPGWSQPHTADLAWASMLRDAARTHDVMLHPTFLATDEGVVLIEDDPDVGDAAA